MKLRISFTFKIILPYLVIASLFLLIFLSEMESENALAIGLSAAGVAASILLGVIHIFWLKRPLYRIRNLVIQLTRGNLPAFNSSSATDEIGDLERNLEKHVENLQALTNFTRSLASGDFTGKYEKLSSEDEIGEALIALKGSLMDSLKAVSYTHLTLPTN